MKDFQPGVTAPPFHVYCRSTTAPYFDESFGQIGERAARDEEKDKTYYVPDDMTYSEWYKKCVKGEEVDKEQKDDIIASGAVARALSPKSSEVAAHAERYYDLVRKMKTDCNKIAENTGFSVDDIKSIKELIFMQKHDLGDGKFDYFAPSFEMAESWQRLIDGKNIQPHDITLLHHEMMERQLMANGFSQSQAHEITSSKYNYQQGVNEYYAEIDKHKKRR